MGVYIKGMKMPDECFECSINDFCRAHRNYTGCKLIDGRLDNCPLVEIPEPHGRLIDADELVRTSGVAIQVTGKENAIVVTQALDSIYQDIKDAPTVIEAEGE